MPKRRARLTLQKSSKKGRKSRGEDTKAYQVESVHAQRIIDNTVHYTVKWEGYPESENTDEPEFRLNCDYAVLRYLITLLDLEKYVEEIPKNDREVDQMCSRTADFLGFIDPISTIALTTIHFGNVKFVTVNTIESRRQYLKHIIRHNQSYQLNAALIPEETQLQNDNKQYANELEFMLNVFSDYPRVSVNCPTVADMLLYAPPPLSNLIFEPITEESFEKRAQLPNLFPPRSEVEGFNGTFPFLNAEYLGKGCKDLQNEIENDRMLRVNHREDPIFRAKLKLTQRASRGWVLRLEEEVEEHTPLLVLCGVVRPCAVAQKSLEEEGDIVGLTSFIEIPGTGVCLDRRELHDFSKYIPHSCQPTCSVRLVCSGHEYPDLVVYSLHAIDQSYAMAITLDYYKMFHQDVQTYFSEHKAPLGKIFGLYDKNRDFVQCQCLMNKCPDVLYVSNMERGKEAQPRKKSTKNGPRMSISPTPPHPPVEYGGLQLTDSNQIWRIVNGKFVE